MGMQMWLSQDEADHRQPTRHDLERLREMHRLLRERVREDRELRDGRSTRELIDEANRLAHKAHG